MLRLSWLVIQGAAVHWTVSCTGAAAYPLAVSSPQPASSSMTARCDFPDVRHISTAWARYSAGHLWFGIGSSSTGLTPDRGCPPNRVNSIQPELSLAGVLGHN